MHPEAYYKFCKFRENCAMNMLLHTHTHTHHRFTAGLKYVLQDVYILKFGKNFSKSLFFGSYTLIVALMR